MRLHTHTAVKKVSQGKHIYRREQRGSCVCCVVDGMVSPGNLTKQALLKAALAFNQVFEAYEGSLCSYGVTSINSRKKRPWKSLFCPPYLRGFFLDKMVSVPVWLWLRGWWLNDCVWLSYSVWMVWEMYNWFLGCSDKSRRSRDFVLLLWELVHVSWIYENKMATHIFAKSVA